MCAVSDDIQPGEAVYRANDVAYTKQQVNVSGLRHNSQYCAPPDIKDGDKSKADLSLGQTTSTQGW